MVGLHYQYWLGYSTNIGWVTVPILVGLQYSSRGVQLTEHLQLDGRRRPLVPADPVVRLADVDAGLVPVHGVDHQGAGGARLLAAGKDVALQ